MTGAIEVWLLGSVEVRIDGTFVPIAGAKTKAIVALLAMAAPHAISDDRLIDELWGEDLPAHPANALQGQMSNLRRLLGRNAIERRGTGYLLAVGPDDVDSIRLERLVRSGCEDAATDDHLAAARHFSAALDLLRGPTLDGLSDFRFGRDSASRIDELVFAAHEGLAAARLATGAHADAVAPLTGLVRAHPLRERLHAQLILALYRCGRQADALRAYQDARRVLVEELGVEPGPELQALEQAVLRHDPSLNAPKAKVEVRAATERAAPVPTSRAPKASRLPLVGRDAELGALGEDLHEALAGHGRVVLLGGEPGIGKTRLAEEVTGVASAQGATVIWGRCYEGRGAPAFWPWIQVLNGFLARFDAEEIRQAVGHGGSELAQIVPELKEVMPEIEPPAPLDPETAQFRLYQAVAGSILRLAAIRPLVVVLDDLHWSDAPSLELLVFLASEMAESSLLVVSTFRNVDPTLGPSLAATLVELARRSTVRRLELAGLDRPGLARLLSAAGAAPDDALLTTVHRRTDGNPFFATEIIRLLPAEGGDARSINRAVPAGVKGVIRQRVARLPEEIKPTITVAACLGQDFDLAVLASTLELDGATLLDHLEPAIEAGILIDNATGGSRYRFSHGLVNETVADDLGVAQRARVHHRIAQALETHHDKTDGPHLLALADHWFRAIPSVPPDKGIAYAIQAAQWAQSHVAHQQAEEQLRTALGLIAGMPNSRRRAELELEVQNHLCIIYIASNIYTGDAFAEICVRMRELCEELGEHELLVPVLWRLSLHHFMHCHRDPAMAVTGELLELGEREGEGATLLVAHMARGTVLHYLGDNRGARYHLGWAVELCDQGHDATVTAVTEQPAVFSRVFSALNWALIGDSENAERVAHEALAVGLRTGMNTYPTTLAMWTKAMVAVLRRDVGLTLQRCDEGIALARKGGYHFSALYMDPLRGWALAAGGAVEEGAAVIRAALDEIGPLYLRPMFLALQADVHLMGGDFTAALAAADEGLEVALASSDRGFEAELHRLRGDALRGIHPKGTEATSEYRMAVDIATAQGSAVQLERARASLAAVS